MKKRNWIILGVVVLAVVAGVVIITNRQRTTTQAAAANVQTGRVVKTTLSQIVQSSGSLGASALTNLSFGTNGTVAKINVNAGDQVKKGDVLAQLDTTKIDLQLAQAQQAYLLQQATYSSTLQVDPTALSTAQIAANNAYNAYKIAQQKAGLTSQQVAANCANVDTAKTALDDAQTAYNVYLSNWRVQVDGSYQLSSKKTRLDSAQAAYDLAVANCTLAQQGLNNTSVTAAWSQYLQAKAALADLTAPRAEKLQIASAQLEQARLTFEQAQLTAAQAQIVAPFDGMVTQVNIQVGGLSASPALVLADLSHYHVNVSVAETDIPTVSPGQNAEITLDAMPGITLTGKVSLIDPAGTVVQGVVNYNVQVDIAPTDQPIKLDMGANVNIIEAIHTGVLAVPTGAIQSARDGTQFVVLATAGASASQTTNQ